ncbi:MAG TPA: serine hydrolase domain-containing protein, partial [Oleiagrimonas sp.]|nr:serine hydrolase domain-containing protein [Oleiagrimonas sp.]
MQLRLAACLLLSWIGLTTPALASPSPASHDTPVEKTLPKQRIADAVHDYNRWIDKIRKRNDVVGLATAVVVGRHVYYERTMGYADARTGTHVTPTTAFRLASLSKAFATAMTGLLVQNGRLSWEARLKNILPFFKLKDIQNTRNATVRDIAGQRLGLPRNSYDLRLEADVPYQELVRQLYRIDPICDVGSCYSYQNIAFSLLGDVIHAKTGSFFGREVGQYIFRP